MSKKESHNNQNIIIVLLIIILSFIAVPYILKFPTQINKIYWQYKESRLREQKRQEKIRFDKENQRRKAILQRYLITTLGKYYPCDTFINNCTFEITIPEIILQYYFGELKDRKLNKVTYCRKDKDDRYSKYCPGEIVGFCNLDLSKLEYENAMSKTRLKNLPTPTFTQQQTQLNLFIEDLHNKGYSGTPDESGIYYNQSFYSNDKCGRLNLINDSSIIQDFQIEFPTIRKMIQENPNETFLQEFSNKSLRNYEILINELQSSMKSGLGDYFELIMQTIQNEYTVDATGDGNPENIYINIGKGCGSCHQKFIYIFRGKSKLFEITGDDAQVNSLPSGNGFTIKQPVRKDDEPLCCPSEYTTDTYIWNGNSFIKQK